MPAATEADGRFRFASVPQEALVLVVTCKGFASVEKKLSPVAQDLTQISIVLLPAPVSGTVTISATRTEMRISETAASVVLLTPKDLEATAALTIDDTLRQVTGKAICPTTISCPRVVLADYAAPLKKLRGKSEDGYKQVANTVLPAPRWIQASPESK